MSTAQPDGVRRTGISCDPRDVLTTTIANVESTYSTDLMLVLKRCAVSDAELILANSSCPVKAVNSSSVIPPARRSSAGLASKYPK